MSGVAELGAEEFAHALLALLPRGLAWPREPETVLARTVAGLAEIVAGQHGRAVELLEREADPARAEELLEDWERAFGLPDPCVGEGQAEAERRAGLLARIAASGGQSRAYFLSIAAALGYSVTIEETRPFLAGVSRAGDPCRDASWRHVWWVRVADKIAEEGVALECVLRRLAPAHTAVHFIYEGP